MYTVKNTLVSESIASEKFCCDLKACQGACCTIPGGRGAPVTDAEAGHIERAVEAALKYLPPVNRRIIEEEGSLEGPPGDVATRCVDDRECVFVYFEENIAKCALERAYFNGESDFRKPLSCHLFPIRIGDLFGGDYLRYEKISECRPGREKGEREGVPLHLFLREAIIRAYGEEYYERLERTIQRKQRGKH